MIVKNADLSLAFSLGLGAGGRPSVTAAGAPDLVLKRENFDIQWLTGGKEQPQGFLNWLINRFEGFITRRISAELRKRFATIFNPAMATILGGLSTSYRLQVPELPRPVQVSAKLAAAPAIRGGSLVLGLDMDISPAGSSCPLSTCPVGSSAGLPASDKYISIMVSQRPPCCALQTGYQLGLLSQKVKVFPQPPPGPGEQPSGVMMNALRSFFSKTSIWVTTRGLKAPVVTFSANNNVKADIALEAELHILRNGATTPTAATKVASIAVAARATVSTALAGNTLKYALAEAQFHIRDMTVLGDLGVPEFAKKHLQDLANWAIRKYGLTKINAMFASGFKLPALQGSSLTSPRLTIGSGFALVQTDFSLAVPPQLMSRNVLIQEDAGETFDF